MIQFFHSNNTAGSTPPVPIELNNGLVSYYKFDEASGDAIDSLSAFNGTVTGTPYNQTGKINTAYLFNTSNSVNIGTRGSDLNLTISCWVNVTGTSGNRTIYSSRMDASNIRGIQFRVATGDKLDFVFSGTAVIAVSIGTVPENTWTHVALTYNSSGLYTFYINGYASGSGTDLRAFEFTTHGIGARRPGSEHFTGLIDEVGIWNRPLISAEILALYNAGNGISYPF